MSLQDRTVVRTAADLERKYNFSKLLGLTKNVETNEENLQKVENELNNMLNSLIINLGDVLDSQTDISLWFYSGIPTTSNAPYTSWATPSDHIGDLYYNQATGYVYKYTASGWVQQTDTNLINAMALTNAELDVSTDHERKVYFSEPTPEYSSGDWWILEDGTLKICQLGKGAGGTYEVNDFVVSSRYTETVATKQNDTITVLKGTVTEITEDYVKFTDLSTGGNTTIAGENITTGNIKSSNYVSGTSGTKIALSDGTIDSKNLKLLSNGDLEIGGYIKTDRGILSNLQYSSPMACLGQQQLTYGAAYIATPGLELNVYIPSNFEVIQATITVNLHKTYNNYMFDYQTEVNNYGKVKNIKLYKENSSATITNSYLGVFELDMASMTEVTGAFGTNGYTASTTNSAKFSSIDIKSSLNSNGVTTFVIKTSDAAYNGETLAGVTNASKEAQIAYATIDIIGYMSN